MAVNFNTAKPISYTQGQTVTLRKDEENRLLSALDNLSQKKQELLFQMQSIQKAIKEVEGQETQFKTQLARLNSPEEKEAHEPVKSENQNIEKKAIAIEELIKPFLLVDTTKIATATRDKEGMREYYSFFLISKENEKVEINKLPINARKYGSISQIVIDNGTSKTILKTDSIFIHRLVHYFTTDFDTFRKEINAEQVDFNGSYSNEHTSFECQRFSYYLQHGKEGTYGLKPSVTEKANYREAVHTPGRFYSLHAKTNDYGKNGIGSSKDISLHHYMCLTNGVFVSKFGSGNVAFSSYKQMLDAYFPDKFTKGHLCNEDY